MDNTIGFDQFRRMAADHFGLEYESVHAEISFLDDLGIDSLSLVNFILKIENKYGIKIEMDIVWSLKNIGEAYDMIMDRINPEGAGAPYGKSALKHEESGASA